MFLLSLLQLWHHILRFSLQAELTFLRDQVKDPPLLKEIVKERNIKSPVFDSNQTHDFLIMMRVLYHFATISVLHFMHSPENWRVVPYNSRTGYYTYYIGTYILY